MAYSTDDDFEDSGEESGAKRDALQDFSLLLDAPDERPTIMRS